MVASRYGTPELGGRIRHVRKSTSDPLACRGVRHACATTRKFSWRLTHPVGKSSDDESTRIAEPTWRRPHEDSCRHPRILVAGSAGFRPDRRLLAVRDLQRVDRGRCGTESTRWNPQRLRNDRQRRRRRRGSAPAARQHRSLRDPVAERLDRGCRPRRRRSRESPHGCLRLHDRSMDPTLADEYERGGEPAAAPLLQEAFERSRRRDGLRVPGAGRRFRIKRKRTRLSLRRRDDGDDDREWSRGERSRLASCERRVRRIAADPPIRSRRDVRGGAARQAELSAVSRGRAAGDRWSTQCEQRLQPVPSRRYRRSPDLPTLPRGGSAAHRGFDRLQRQRGRR